MQRLPAARPGPFNRAEVRKWTYIMDGPAFVFLEKLACKMQIVEFCFEVRNYLLYDFKVKTNKIKGNGKQKQWNVAGKECSWFHAEVQDLVSILSMDDIF